MDMKCPKCDTENTQDSQFCKKCATQLRPAEEISITRTIVKSADELPIGSTFAEKYRVLGELGRGGMGVVYKAEDMKLKRFVALKLLPSELSSNEEAKERFIQEAQAAAALSHPNICTIYEVEAVDEKTYIAMEYIEGESLREKTVKSPSGIEEALDTAIQAASGLEEAHRKGIIHRDIKSANIMVGEKNQAKIMDFGLAKVAGAALITKEARIMGTVAYMSPEQARGETIDHRSDIWSLGVVLYEMMIGRLPFGGDNDASILYSIEHREPLPIRKFKADIPVELERIINRALKKRPESRYQSASEMLNDLKQFEATLKAPEVGITDLRSFFRVILKPRIAVPAIIVIVASCLFAILLFNRSAKIRRLREQTILEIEQLSRDGDSSSAYKLAREAEKYIPNDSRLITFWPGLSRQVTIESDPAGAKVYRKFYAEMDEEWEYLGQTPIEKIRFPHGVSRMKFEKEGYQTLNVARTAGSIGRIIFKLDEEGSIPDDMVRVLGGEFKINLIGLETLKKEQLDDYLIDKYEVSNKKFKQFVDSGGYEKQEYWKHPFVKAGRTLSWEEAMTEFKDRTGRPGPATWEVGDYPDGQDDYPVAGISWYEAAAYAEFVGKSLPTIFHWSRAAGINSLTVSVIVPLSNLSGQGPAPVGSYEGMSTYGTYDMAGNAREWCWNKCEEDRYILGGGSTDPIYMFTDAYAQDPFDRNPINGFRCIKYLQANEKLLILKRSIPRPSRDFKSDKPVSDEVFKIYMGMYAYDKTELNAKIESVDESAEDWIKERISFDAAYGNESVIAYLFLPRTGNPPYQTIVYFPSSNGIHIRTSESLTPRGPFLKSGRAVMFPIYKSTYERGDDLDSDMPDETVFWKEHVIMWAKDLGRSIDYLETRTDIDADKLAYYGASWGAAMAPILNAVEKRFKACIIEGGGLDLCRTLPEVDQFNFVPRVTIPVLMLNGRYDHYFPVETSQIPMFQLLGTPPEHKHHKIFEKAGHVVPNIPSIKEELDFLDRYLGPVR